LGGVTVLVPISRAFHDSKAVAALLGEAHFQPVPPAPFIGAERGWRNGALQLWTGSGCFASWAPWVDVGVATAGTATEQLAGLGVPALSLPGPGPQFTAGFARRQSRLLGEAVQPCNSPEQLRARLVALLQDDQARARLGWRGRQRMGSAGGSEALARLIEERLLGLGAATPSLVAG
jgi:uncharacterized protein (TIGR03492 family)